MRWTVLGCIASLLVGSTVHASEHGCTVLLCLANPDGPKALKECRPPIKKLFRDLALGKSFPKCDLKSADGGGGQSYARQEYSYYDPCPEGTTELAKGSRVVQGPPLQNTKAGMPAIPPELLFTGIGSGDGFKPNSDNYLPGKVCVGNLLGGRRIRILDVEKDINYKIGVAFYDRVVLLNPATSPNIIDVYIDNKLYRRVRWEQEPAQDQ